MRILIDINHPAHVHVFRVPIALLKEAGHEVLITSRDKDCTTELLDELELSHLPLSIAGGKGILALLKELVFRNLALWRVVKRFRPDVMASVGGTFIAHVGFVTRTPSLVFYDTENAMLQNLITYPFAHRVIVPRCYKAWVPKTHERYNGYHELSYLGQNRFKPSKDRALANGLAPEGDTFLIRTVSWQANHDIGKSGWGESLLRAIVLNLSERGKVLISAEGELPDDLFSYAYTGSPGTLHDVLGHCRLFVGESATVASEAAVLGVPALYIAETRRGYTDEQEQRYGLVRTVQRLDWYTVGPALQAMLRRPRSQVKRGFLRMQSENIDVGQWIAERIRRDGQGAN